MTPAAVSEMEPSDAKMAFRALTGDDNSQRDSAEPVVKAPARKKKEPQNANAMNPAIYSGNKVRHLKKDDGEPLWRKDIQYDFLKLIFENDQAVFTNSYEPETIGKQTFANVYIDAMARSSKTSKILRDKLLSEHEPAKNMAMVCLLVNLGRMNTTLNFFPEMRAQLRTYHAIPSLQAHQDPNSYKQLQDAPRLKSILKGASEDRPEPNTMEKIKHKALPRTNPVNLIFVLSQYASKVTELHFPPTYDFYDLLMRTSLSSKSRATAFLWLMWFYLESDFTEEGANENPFGAGVDYDTDVKNQGVPRLTTLVDEEEAQENIDTPEEIEYGQGKMRERKRIIEADQIAFQAENGPPKRGPKPKLHLPPDEGSPAGSAANNRTPAAVPGRMRPRYESDIDSTRSTPPPRVLGGASMRNSVLSTGAKGRGGGGRQMHDGSSPAPQASESTMRRPRPLTAHQLAVERNRNQRVDYILSRGLRKEHSKARQIRREEGAFVRSYKRLKRMPDYQEDSEGESSMYKDPGAFRDRGFGGLVQLESEEDDFGEEMAAYAAAFRRMGRRLDRWDAQKDKNLGVMGTHRVAQKAQLEDANGHCVGRDVDETEDEMEQGQEQAPQRGPKRRIVNGKARIEEEEDLDDMEKEILGLQSDNEESPEAGADGGEEDLDDVDKALLGIRGDETEVEDDGSEGAMDVE